MIHNEVKNALIACILTFLSCVIVYPAAVWGTARLAFPREAEGSLVHSRERGIVGSGLDPQISVEGALYQVERVAKARGLALETIRAMVDQHIDTRGYLIGAPPRVNVLALNRALDEGTR